MKNKFDFYIAFYERLALQGFQAYVAYDRENHIADICVRGNNIAHLTKADTIRPNPYAEVDAGTIDAICETAKNTALMCGICTEKPYDETKHEKLPNGAYKLSEFEDTVLSCACHPILGYVFSVSKPPEAGYTDRQDFYNKADAMRDFAIKSGFVDERQFFSFKELAMIQAGLTEVRMAPDNDLTSEETYDLDALIEKVEGLTPESADIWVSLQYSKDHDAELSEGVEQ